jgi:CubicO group peptidase (beta-lactamase class C family)
MRGLVAGLVVLALVPLARGEEKSPPLERIRARMQEFVSSQDIAGAVTVVGRADGVLHHEAVGFQDLDRKSPMTKDSLFRIASMTKPITAVGIMILVEEGKLGLDDPVEKHLPAFKGQMLIESKTGDDVKLKKPQRPITLRDLLTHTSGLPGGYPSELGNVYLNRDRTLEEVILVMGKQPLVFEPGTKWAYCNTGIDTLGRIIEVASGKSYQDFLKERVFDPLGMADTTFFPTQDQLKRLAITYAKDADGKLTPNQKSLIGLPPDAKHPIPAGGLYSTGADLAQLYRMMLNRGALGKTRIISEKSVAEMTRVQTGELRTGFVDGMSFGLGWGVVHEPRGVTAMLSPGTYGHGGAFGTQGWMDPKRDLFVVLLIQRTGLRNGDASPMREALQELAVQAVTR